MTFNNAVNQMLEISDAAGGRFLKKRANMEMADRVISIVALVFGAV